jgi:uncharacterized protein
MKRTALVLASSLLVLGAPASTQAQVADPGEVVQQGPDQPVPWMLTVSVMAEADLQHPSWGVRHAQRNYQTALALAEAEGLAIDEDVLYAAAYLHDWGALEPFAIDGTPHEVRSVELAEPFLRDAGFPMEKWPAVRDAILGHVPAGQPTTPEGIVLHDADLLDFMGAEGVARFFGAPSDEPNLDQGVSYIENFGLTLGGRLLTDEARRLAEPRLAYMRGFLEQLRSELPPGTQP